jgi:hypothetical protein
VQVRNNNEKIDNFCQCEDFVCGVVNNKTEKVEFMLNYLRVNWFLETQRFVSPTPHPILPTQAASPPPSPSFLTNPLKTQERTREKKRTEKKNTFLISLVLGFSALGLSLTYITLLRVRCKLTYTLFIVFTVVGL